MGEKQPQRKGLRLKQFDYNAKSAYFLTICTKDRKCILSKIVEGMSGVPEIVLSDVGKVVERNILSINDTEYATVDYYVIMPDHIHLIVCINQNEAENTTPANQTVPHIVSTFKRFCRKELSEGIFQRSYYDHIIRDREDYETRMNYIYENPIKSFFERKYEANREEN